MVRNHARKNDARRHAAVGRGPYRRTVHLSPRVPTGLESLDQLLGGGFRRGRVSVVAARTAMGKSMLAMSFVRHASFRLHRPALLASLEMDEHELFHRVVAAETGLPTHLIARRGLTDDQVAHLKRSMQHLTSDPIYMTGARQQLGRVTVNAVAQHCATVRDRQGGLDLVVVDYLGLMRGPRETPRGPRPGDRAHRGRIRRPRSRVRHRGPHCRTAHPRPVFRADHRPRLDDMQHHETLRRHADAFVLLHRDQYYRQSDDRWHRQSPDLALYAEDAFPRLGLPETIVQRADLSVAHRSAGTLRTTTIGVDLSRCRFFNEPPAHP